MQKNYIKVTDITFACTASLYHPLDHVEKTEDGKTAFIFENTPELQITTEKYLKQELLVEPISFSNKMRNMKSLIHIGGTNAPS